MTLADIYNAINCELHNQGKYANLYIAGVGCILMEGKIQQDTLDNFVREQEEYKAQQELRK